MHVQNRQPALYTPGEFVGHWTVDLKKPVVDDFYTLVEAQRRNERLGEQRRGLGQVSRSYQCTFPRNERAGPAEGIIGRFVSASGEAKILTPRVSV